LNLSDYPLFDVNKIIKILAKCKEDKKYDIMGFRDYSFKSVITNNIAPIHDKNG
jgi:trimethylamine monooxygenase